MRRLLRPMLIVALLSGACGANDMQNHLTFLPAEELPPTAAAAKGPNGEPAIEVTGESSATTTTILVCPDPGISAPQYALRGKVKYEGVTGDGYLELWNDFGPQGQFFTRSLAPMGKLKKLNGNSGWRDFELPFQAHAGMRPKALTLNVVLPAGSNVIVAQPTLVELTGSSAWWSGQQAGLWGGILGSLMGCLGAAIGILTSRNAPRGVLLALYVFGISLSSVSLVAGILAAVTGQPWHVGYVLILLGVIGCSVLGINLWNLLQRFRGDELRRINAVDA